MSDTSTEETSWFDEATQAVESAYDATVDAVETAYDTTVQTVEQTYDAGAQAVEQAYDYGAQVVEEAYDYGAQTVEQAYDYGAQAVQDTYQWAVDTAEQAYNWATGGGSGTDDGSDPQESEQELVIDMSQFPSLQLLAQSGSFEGWLASAGVSTSVLDDPCLQDWADVAVSFGLCVAAVVAIFAPPLTAAGVIGLVYEGYSLVRGIEGLGECYEKAGRTQDAGAVRQQAGALQGDLARLEAAAS